MPEKTKRNKDFENAAKEETAGLPNKQQENNAKDTWSADQQEKSYYYDDSYGYEVYNPDEEDED
jgi:spore germination protein YaaH